MINEQAKHNIDNQEELRANQWIRTKPDQLTVENSFFFSEKFYNLIEKYIIPDFLENERKNAKKFQDEIIVEEDDFVNEEVEDNLTRLKKARMSSTYRDVDFRMIDCDVPTVIGDQPY